MNEEDIREMVRESVERKIREEIASLRTSPKNFQHYHRILTSTLSKRGVSPHILLHIESPSSREVFGVLHEVWSDIESELSLTHTPAEREGVWRDISQHYIEETVRKISEIII